MRMIDELTAENYLREKGHISPGAKITLRELAGGVSNVVLYVSQEDPSDDDFVLKQARERLRVPEPWYCSVTRIWRESHVLRLCESLLPDAEPKSQAEENLLEIAIPRILFEDKDNYLFAMSAAPLNHRTWKSDLLAGTYSRQVADACGRLLGRLHSRSWLSSEIAMAIGDRQFFEHLRIDPYYRTTAEVHEELRPAFTRLIESLSNNSRCLVHGDFSPKNLLVCEKKLLLIDFEVGHYGDPAFDLGFFLSHLVLKAFHQPTQKEKILGLTEIFWESYKNAFLQRVSLEEFQDLEMRAFENFAGCTLARIDGKSKVEYLLESDCHESIRRLCREVFSGTTENWRNILDQATRLAVS